jgi:hypothetical protein
MVCPFFAAKSTKYSKKFLMKGMFVDRYGVVARLGFIPWRTGKSQ